MKYLSFIVISLLFMSCNVKQKESNKESLKSNHPVYSIDELMENAEKLLGKEVHFKGLVNHVCAHSGKRCILKNTKGNLSIRVEATKGLEGFDKEMAGNDIVVSGILREKRMATEAIDKFEADVKAEQDAEEGGEHCSSEMANITEMRAWMKKNNKDYYAIYYVDGSGYEVVK